MSEYCSKTSGWLEDRIILTSVGNGTTNATCTAAAGALKDFQVCRKLEPVPKIDELLRKFQRVLVVGMAVSFVHKCRWTEVPNLRACPLHNSTNITLTEITGMFKFVVKLSASMSAETSSDRCRSTDRAPAAG